MQEEDVDFVGERIFVGVKAEIPNGARKGIVESIADVQIVEFTPCEAFFDGRNVIVDGNVFRRTSHQQKYSI